MLGIQLLVMLTLCNRCLGQHSWKATPPLRLIKAISLPQLRGRIDHVDVDTTHQLAYIAALGSHSLVVVDLRSGTVLHTISGLSEPQGVAYIPEQHEIFVADGGTGDGRFYDAHTYQLKAVVHMGSDADNVRYDPSSHLLYVGYGEGGIALIKTPTHQLLASLALPGHPESFQIDSVAHTLYVNVPITRMVYIVDLRHLRLVDAWRSVMPRRNNFPMALDTHNHRLFVGYRDPALLQVLDSRTGNLISEMDMNHDADDMFFDPQTSRLYVSCGAGSIDIYQQVMQNHYGRIAIIPTRRGARTSLLLPDQALYLVAEPSESGQPACLLLYQIL